MKTVVHPILNKLCSCVVIWLSAPGLSADLIVYLCPCGYYGDSLKPCTCAEQVVTKYQKQISGPMLDRMGIHLEVPRVDHEKMSNDCVGESSESIRKRVQAARDIQQNRFSNGNLDISFG